MPGVPVSAASWQHASRRPPTAWPSSSEPSARAALVPLPGHLTEGERAAALAEIEPALVVGEEPGGISVGNLGGGDEARGSGDRLGTGRSARPAEVQGVASGAAGAPP